MPQLPHDSDRRRRRTREALQSAFLLLALERRYHEIRIEDILERSGVGRSTFYEHFAGKNALLAASMGEALSLLAALAEGKTDLRPATGLLEHFWEHRALARTVFQGTALRAVRNALMARIETQLGTQDRLQLPPRLAAHALADALLSPILAWLSGEAACSPADLAAALQRSATAMREGLRAER